MLDLGKHLESVGRPLCLSVAGATIWLGLTEVLLEGQDLFDGKRLIQSIVVMLLLLGAARSTHRNMTALGFLVLVLSVVAFLLFCEELA